MIEHYVECNECSFKRRYVPHPYRFKRWVYDLGVGAVAPMISRISWCYDCANFMRIEKLVSQNDISTMLADYAQTVKTGSRMPQDDLEFADEVLKSEAQWRAFAAERKESRCRCINCGSINTEAEAEFGFGGKINSLLHPRCYGKLCVVEVKRDIHIFSKLAGTDERKSRAIFSRDGLLKIVEELSTHSSSLEAVVPDLEKNERIELVAREDHHKHPTKFLKNPFYILGVSVFDNELKIREQTALRAQSYELDRCTDACRALVDLGNRLTAEVIWAPGVQPDKTFSLMRDFHSSADWLKKYNLIRGGGGLPTLAAANFLAAALELIDPEEDEAEAANVIMDLAVIMSLLEESEILLEINRDRKRAGFQPVNSIRDVEYVLSTHIVHYLKVVKNAVNAMSEEKVDSVVSNILKICGDGHLHLLDRVFSAYESKANFSLEPAAAKLSQLVKNLTENNAYSLEMSDALIDELANNLRAWNATGRQLRINLTAYGRKHKLSQEVYLAGFHVLLLLISGNRFQQGSRLLQAMQASFDDVPEYVSKLAETGRVIQKNRAEYEEAQKAEELKTRQSSIQTSEAIKNVADTRKKVLISKISTGFFWGKKFCLYSTEIEWKNQRMALDDITWILWAGIPILGKNGQVLKFDTVIRIGNDEDSIEIGGLSEKKAKAVIDCLRRPVCHPLVSAILVELESGKQLNFGDASLDDSGIYLMKREHFARDRVYYTWDEVNAGNQNGCLVIASKRDQDTYVKIPYLEVKNAHLLEMIMMYVVQKGIQKISDLLQSS